MSWLRKLGRATKLWGSGNSALSYLSGNVDWRRQRDMANTAYQRAAADKLAAGINPLFDGAAASPVASSDTADSGDSILQAIQLPLGLVNSALSSVSSVADSMSKFASSAKTGEEVTDLRLSRADRMGMFRDALAKVQSEIFINDKQYELLDAELDNFNVKLDNIRADTAQKNALSQEISKRILKLGHEISSAKSQADVDAVVSQFQTGLGGDIQRWTTATGVKGSDVIELVKSLRSVGALFKSARKFGFQTK